MFRWLLIIGLVLVGITILSLGIGLSQQQPFLFGLAILCTLPISAFFLGGAVFNFAANYSIQPKAADTKIGRKLGANRGTELG